MFYVIDGQNMRDQIKSYRRSKHAWSDCVFYIPFILSGSPNKANEAGYIPAMHA